MQTEDDITASVVVPGHRLPKLPDYLTRWQGASRSSSSRTASTGCSSGPTTRFTAGSTSRPRPTWRGATNFISNFEPLSRARGPGHARAGRRVRRVHRADARTLLRSVDQRRQRLRRLLGQPAAGRRQAEQEPALPAEPAGPGRPFPRYVAEMGTRLWRAVPADQPRARSRSTPCCPAGATTRRTAQQGIRSLAVYNPIHYQELPELFMDFICSLTGKSPSTTGAGQRRGADQGPFNALRPIADLNAALVSMILTGLPGFSTAAGYVGPQHRVDHDISLLVPEIWARMSPAGARPGVPDGREAARAAARLRARRAKRCWRSRLGYRITARFVRPFFGRVFDNPDKVFDESILRPETQDLEAFVDGVKNIIEA